MVCLAVILNASKDGVISLPECHLGARLPCTQDHWALTLPSPFPGWEVAGDHIYTAVGASDNDFMILTLVVPGFR